nr:hypothetical protein [Tanacetum cinerariifolium]
FFIISSIAVQTPDSGISNLLAVGTTFTGSGNLYCQWELSPSSGNSLSRLDFYIIFRLRDLPFAHFAKVLSFGCLCLLYGVSMLWVDAYIVIEVDVRVGVEDEVEEEVESSDSGTIEDRELKARSLISDGEKDSLLKQVESFERSNARLRGTMMMERARADRFWRRMSFMESELRQIRRFRYYDRMRLRRLETFAARRLSFHP